MGIFRQLLELLQFGPKGGRRESARKWLQFCGFFLIRLIFPQGKFPVDYATNKDFRLDRLPV
jgi:hypothetical protein